MMAAPPFPRVPTQGIITTIRYTQALPHCQCTYGSSNKNFDAFPPPGSTSSFKSVQNLNVQRESTGTVLPLYVKRFYLPELSSAYHIKCNPSYESIRGHISSWLLHWTRPHTVAEQNLLLQSDFPSLACLIVPNSPHRNRMLLFSQLMAWLTRFQDMEEEHLDSSGELKECIMRILEDRPTVQDLHRRRDAEALYSVLQLLRVDMSPRLHHRHIQALKSFFLLFSDVDEKQKVLTDLPSYISACRNRVATDHLQIMTEYCLGIELDDDTLGTESMKKLHLAAADYIGWSSDLLSFRKKYYKRDLHNLPSVVYMQGAEERLDFQTAVNRVHDMIRGRNSDLVVLLQENALSDFASGKPELRWYLLNVVYWLSGFVQWFYTSARLHGVDHKVAKLRSGFVEMDPNTTVLKPF